MQRVTVAAGNEVRGMEDRMRLLYMADLFGGWKYQPGDVVLYVINA